MATSMMAWGTRAPSIKTPPDSRMASASGAAHRSSQIDVLHVGQPTDFAVNVTEDTELVKLVELNHGDLAVGVLGDEHQVEDTDGSFRHQLDQLGGDPTVELVAGKRHDDVLHRSDCHPIPLRRE